MVRNLVEWEEREHMHTEKSSDWYWAVGIISVSAAVTAIIFSNILFAIVIIVGSFALTMHAVKEPLTRRYELSDRGVAIDDHFFPYKNLESYWVDEHLPHPSILFKTKKFFMPFLIVPLPDHFDPDDVRDYLREHLPMVEHHEPFLHKLLEYLGF